MKTNTPNRDNRYFGPSVGIPSNDPGVWTRMSSTPTNRVPPPIPGPPGVGASRSLTLAPCFPANDLVSLLVSKRRGEWVNYAQIIDTGNKAGESGSIAVS